jgi:hypothetical protein
MESIFSEKMSLVADYNSDSDVDQPQTTRKRVFTVEVPEEGDLPAQKKVKASPVRGLLDRLPAPATATTQPVVRQGTTSFFNFEYDHTLPTTTLVKPAPKPSTTVRQYTPPPIQHSDKLDATAITKLIGRKARLNHDTTSMDVVDVSFSDHYADIARMQQLATPAPQVELPETLRPTDFQKKRHNIRALAFQAKLQQHELEEKWAQDKRIKKETANKYGW